MIDLRIAPLMAVTVAAIAVGCSRLHDAEMPGPPVRSLRATEATSPYGMVSTGTVDATRAGVKVLEGGGNAIDAAVAAAITLGVVDPGDSGLGGTTYMLVHSADGRNVAISGSAVVPVAVDHERLRQLAREKRSYGVELIAVPGSLGALDHAVRRYGTRPLAELIEPAIELADNGYRPNAFQLATMESYIDELLDSDFLRFIVLEGGESIPTGERPTYRPWLARTLRIIGLRGAREFYRGRVANLIATDISTRGGWVQQADLALYQVNELEPARTTYRGKEVLSFPSPGAGAAVVHALDILENFPPATLAADTVDRHQILIDAFHIAIADFHSLIEPAHLRPESLVTDYLSKDFAASRAALIRPGHPVTDEEIGGGEAPFHPEGNTTQISVVDRFGNAVSLTQTLGRFFGSKIATRALGFPYNNLLEGQTDVTPRQPLPTAMSPSIVLDDGEVMMVLGSAGSSRIPGVIATVVSNVIDRHMGLGRAITYPRVLWGEGDGRGAHAEIHRPISRGTVDLLEARGYTSMIRAQLPTPVSRLSRFGAVNAILVDRHSHLMTGVADPRRYGSAIGASR